MFHNIASHFNTCLSLWLLQLGSLLVNLFWTIVQCSRIIFSIFKSEFKIYSIWPSAISTQRWIVSMRDSIPVPGPYCICIVGPHWPEQKAGPVAGTLLCFTSTPLFCSTVTLLIGNERPNLETRKRRRQTMNSPHPNPLEPKRLLKVCGSGLLKARKFCEFVKIVF